MIAARSSPRSPTTVPSFAPSCSPIIDITKLITPNAVTAKRIGKRTVPSASPTARSSRLSAAPLTSSRHPCQIRGASSSPRSTSMSPQTAVANRTPAPAQRAADPSGPARPVPMSIPAAGITTSHRPKTVATLSSVRRSTPPTPMAIAAPKLFSPSARATTSSATIINEHLPNGSWFLTRTESFDHMTNPGLAILMMRPGSCNGLGQPTMCLVLVWRCG
jgi:hypothetical protein